MGVGVGHRGIKGLWPGLKWRCDSFSTLYWWCDQGPPLGGSESSEPFAVLPSGWPDHFTMPSQSLVKEAKLKMMPDGHLPHSFQVRSPKWSPAKIMSPVKLGFLLHPTSLSLTPTFLVYTNGFPFVGCLLLQIFLFSPRPALPHSL